MSGSKWKFMKTFEIPDATDRSQIYLKRWNVIVTPWFSLKIHNIRLPDGDRALHCHPWSFGTLILKGGYLEEQPLDPKQNHGNWVTEFVARNRWSWHRVPAEGLHRIHEVAPNTWTLVITTGSERTWGFSPRAGEWMDWRTYLGVPPEADSGD